MEWHINDLSICGQFTDSHQFKTFLEQLLQLRNRYPYFKNNFYTSRQLFNCQVTATTNLHQAIIATKDKTFIRLALELIVNSGPFWDDLRQSHDYDHFEFNGEDVTDQGLGETARRLLAGKDALSFSFQGLTIFEKTPLTIQHGFSGDDLEPVTASNDWQIEQLEEALRNAKEIKCWTDLQEEIVHRFDGIHFSKNVMEKLLSMPFSRSVSNRIIILLEILNRLAKETIIGSGLTPIGEEIHNTYFAGATADKMPLFKPESATNESAFKIELTFIDPEDPGKKIFCPWHGKIQTPQIRIHFEWPKPKEQVKIKVVYIGPKITKD